MPRRTGRRANHWRLTGRARAVYLQRRLGVSLRDARIGMGLTQGQLAERAGVSQGWISELELGKADAFSRTHPGPTGHAILSTCDARS